MRSLASSFSSRLSLPQDNVAQQIVANGGIPALVALLDGGACTPRTAEARFAATHDFVPGHPLQLSKPTVWVCGVSAVQMSQFFVLCHVCLSFCLRQACCSALGRLAISDAAITELVQAGAVNAVCGAYSRYQDNAVRRTILCCIYIYIPVRALVSSSSPRMYARHCTTLHTHNPLQPTAMD